MRKINDLPISFLISALGNITVDENAIGSPARKKRSYEPDQDLCCDT